MVCFCECVSDVLLIIVSVLFPPLPVWIRTGVCSMDSLVNILLCVFGYLPGLVHSWYILAKYPPCSRNHESKVYYIYQNSSDLEGQNHCSHLHSQPHDHDHDHDLGHSHSHSHSYGQGLINREPSAIFSPDYGSTNESTLVEGRSSDNVIPGAPPAYSELPSKK